MKIINVTPGILPIPPNGWGATEKIIWEYHTNLQKLGYVSEIKYLDEVVYNNSQIVHIHVANLALMAKERSIPYYFTCHDHHSFLYGKNSTCFKENYDAIKYSIKSFVPAKYLVNYFDLPNLQYLSHGVNSDLFKKINTPISTHKLLCVANNGFIHDQSEDRKGFGYAIEAAKILNLPITIAGPSNNKKFFEKNNFDYKNLTVLYDLSEEDLIKLYQNHTIFIHPSILEAGHPNLTLLEAMSCGLPVVGTFEDNNKLPGLIKTNRDVNQIVKSITEVVSDYQNYQEMCANTVEKLSWKNITNELISIYTNKSNMKQQLVNIYENVSINHRPPAEEQNKLIIDFNNQCKIEILGSVDKNYNVKFIDNDVGKLIYESNIKNNMWACSNLSYYINWRIEIVELDTNASLTYNFNAVDKNVKIINESPSIGDYIAWMPFVDLFQKKHNCVVDFYTPNKDLFEKSYTNINFYNYNSISEKKYYATYKIGCFDPSEKNLSPKDYRTQNLQQIAADILGVQYSDLTPNLIVNDKQNNLSEKYVCISTSSTAGCKHWQNKGGWQSVVNYLNQKGYKVVVIQKEPLDYMDLEGLHNVIHPKTENLQQALTWLYNCEFFVGLSSGISWLAWCLKKPIILISGFTKSFNEFYTPHRVINNNVCNGCWNNTSYKFDGGDWNWCPVYKNTTDQFKCSKEITFEAVKLEIDKILNSHIKNIDELTYKEIFEWNQYQKFVDVDHNDCVVDLGCSKGYFYFKNLGKNIDYIGVDGSVDCLHDFLENLNGDKNPLLIHSLIGYDRKICTFESMFHNNNLQKTMSLTFEDLLKQINRKINFLKFDIEGYEYSIFDNYYELFKKNVEKFAGEIHFCGHLNRRKCLDILKKICNDDDLSVKLHSTDGVEITEYFWTNTDYYTEIILSGRLINKKV